MRATVVGTVRSGALEIMGSLRSQAIRVVSPESVCWPLFSNLGCVCSLIVLRMPLGFLKKKESKRPSGSDQARKPVNSEQDYCSMVYWASREGAGRAAGE